MGRTRERRRHVMPGNSKLASYFTWDRNACKFLAWKTLCRQSAVAEVRAALPLTAKPTFRGFYRATNEDFGRGGQSRKAARYASVSKVSRYCRVIIVNTRVSERGSWRDSSAFRCHVPEKKQRRKKTKMEAKAIKAAVFVSPSCFAESRLKGGHTWRRFKAFAWDYYLEIFW